MPSEMMIQQVMEQFRGFSKEHRDDLLTAVLAHKASQMVEGASLVMDPAWARTLQPILDDEVAREALLQALLRLRKEEKKTGWRRFFGGS